MEVRCQGNPVAARTFIVANHLSWLDIPVLATATGCAFISKAEVRNQPFLRWLADQNQTLYVDRSQRSAVHEQAVRVRDALLRGQPLALFPEGTVGHGGRLLPFKPSLLAAVAPPPENVTIRPVAIDYGHFARAIGWAPGEAGVSNALRILGRKGRIPVVVRFLDELAPTEDRKALARAAHDAIALALAPSGIVPARV
ncbi:MAG TPA: lysophospholipid acyltransferase family protein [Sphingomicrobium sp.]|nr:lysophospholipid acyltransferase family protein [Sphingomicrobium sp.]